ncbi:MAG: pilus assembly protein TadB [Clostridiales bacterium]|nr:pilus assembly protein TadB [Clostridiales bacterium]
MVQDYNIYSFSIKEYIRYIFEGLIGIGLLGILFYKNLAGILLLSPLVLITLRRKKKDLVKKRKWQLNTEFRDGINSLSAALSAGYSAEHSFIEAIKDLRRMYPKDAMIIKEFTYLVNRIQMNVPIEKALKDLGDRSDLEDIINFSEVFSIAKRTGGDLIRIIKTSSNLISDKLQVKRDIMSIIAAKKLEATIMKLVPLAILCYLSITSPGLLDPLYNNLFGVLVMTILLVIYIITYVLIDKITAIEV